MAGKSRPAICENSKWRISYRIPLRPIPYKMESFVIKWLKCHHFRNQFRWLGNFPRGVTKPCRLKRHFQNKAVAPAWTSSFHKCHHLPKSICPRSIDRLLLKYSVAKLVGTSFHKQNDLKGSLYKQSWFIKCYPGPAQHWWRKFLQYIILYFLP